MKLLNKTRLHFSSENSDKIYEVDLVEVSERKNQYLVNFRYGRRGQTLREGTKTPTAVTKTEAQKLFDSVVIAKLNKGYVDVGQAVSSASQKTAMPSSQAMYPEMKDSESHVRALMDQLSQTKSSKKRARLAWRLGELGRPEAITTLYGFIHKGDWLEDYAIAWAIGRCGNHKHSEYLIPLLQHKEEKVRHIAFEAQLKLAPQHLKADLLKPALSQLPEALKSLLTGPSTEILAELERLFAYPDANHHTMLVALYRAAVIFVNLHSAMIELMKTLPFKPGYFKGIRHLFKAAEFRQDALMFAILTYRFETTPPFFRHDWDYAYVADKGSLRPSKELKKADSSLAYSNKTQSYFRKRCWRSIRRLGDANSPDYVPLAAAILMQMSDDDQGEEQSGETYHYDDNWNRQLVAANEYGLYANFLSFNHIIYHNSPHYQLGKSGKAWLKLGQENHQRRTEAYPHLWDQQLDEVENLLTHSRCEPVHRFCCRIAQDHLDHFATLQPQTLSVWLNQPYTCTQQLAFTLAKAQIEHAFYGDLLLGLLRSKDETARQYAMD
jgi:predicted DNA-binding WGR domain protein